jgi:hypothetical protein
MTYTSTNELMNYLFPNDIPALEPDMDSLREVAAVCKEHGELEEFLATLDPILRAELLKTTQIPEFV